MPRIRPATVPAGLTTQQVVEPLTPKLQRVPQPNAFQQPNTKGPVTLDAVPHAPAAVTQNEVFDIADQIKPRQPQTVVDALKKLDTLPGVTVESLGAIDRLPMQVATVKGRPALDGSEPKKILITGGVHGSEPAGTISAVSILQLVAEHPEKFPGLEFTFVPLVNPEGFRDGTRRNHTDDADLNREVVRDGTVPKEIELVLPVLDRGPWALALDLHASGSTTADGKNGFFAIRTEGNAELLHAVVTEFQQTNHPVLDETTERYTMIEPGVMESKNVGTMKQYLFDHGTPAAFTLEAPALNGLQSQVDGMVALVEGFLRRVNPGDTAVA